MRAGIDYRLLGPLEVWAGGKPLPLGGAKQRATLALLLLHANEPVSTDLLIDALWGERPPGTAKTALQGYITALRRMLEPRRKKRAAGEVLVTTAAGYVLEVAEGALDRDCFETLAAEGHAALVAGRPGQAAELCRSALAVWRGPALAEFVYEAWAQTEAQRLAELRLVSLEERIDADLQLGRHAELVPELEALIAEQPLRERPRALLMLALYRAGRQAEALNAYQEARRVLVDELGIDPSAALRELEAAILRQDAELAAGRVPALPEGTVTLLSTDIEGSTRLLHELGAEQYAEALQEHRRLLRGVFARLGGVEVDTQGDAFLVSFPTPKSAVQAAESATGALASGPIRVRTGIHTGAPLLTAEGYVGVDVHRVARIAAAAHGGQVLVSEATAGLLEDSNLVDLGDHRLKDLTAAVRLYQIGEEEFPPLKTLYQTNLPGQPTPLVGREAELAEVLELLSASRLLTLTGAGGSGKTRLALQAAAELVDEYEDGVWWVSLAALRDPELVEPTIAQVVGAKDGVAEHLRSKQTLLLLDNFEQVLEAAPAIADLLAEALDVRVLATSRERLGLRAEQEYPVPTLAPVEAVALFTARARQLKPGFEPDDDVEGICRRLDGLPLALELAAARVKLLTPQQILARLAHGLELLTGGARDAPERQRTLEATIAWSYELLTDQEQELFARLAVFVGSFDLEAAEAVCEADLDALAGLVDKSLLRHTDESRFFLLETIRAYALERLEASDEADALPRRHAVWCLALAERAAREIRGGDQARWLDRLEAELDNMRAALSWSLDGSDPATGLDLYPALTLFFFHRDYIAEEALWAGKAMSRLSRASPDVTAKVLWAAGTAALFTDHTDAAESLLQRSLDAARAAEDPVQTANALLFLGAVASQREELERAVELGECALGLYRDAGDQYGVAVALHHLGERHRDAGEYRRAAKLLSESATLWRQHGNLLDSAQSLHSLGDMALDEEKFDRAAGLYRESLGLARSFDAERLEAYCLAGIAAAAAGKGDWSKAACLWGAVQTIEESIQVRLLGEERRRYERLVSDPRRLDPDALRQGRALTADAAVEYALTSID